MPSDSTPPPPTRTPPTEPWPHLGLYERVKDVLAALPAYFATEVSISGILATDLHTLNSVLGAAIEEQVVATLNATRRTWDPDETYALYSFVRQPQTFPDVLLRRAPSAQPGPADDIIMGIELKGWYLLAKEGMPNFRFTVAPGVCNPQDLLVVVPWVLSQVISGRPLVFSPYVEVAGYAAEIRDHHWQHLRGTEGKRDVTYPADPKPYPVKSKHIDAKPAEDNGGNFGRYARTGEMDTYIHSVLSRSHCGIRVRHWLDFFKSFQESEDDEKIKKELSKLAARASKERTSGSLQGAALEMILLGLRKLAYPDE